MTPEHFADHLRVIATRYEPVPLRALVAAAREGHIEDGAVAVTFDDGYSDNLLAAKPLLERSGVPATVFVASGFAGRAFWWDELEWLLLRPGRLPATLTLEIEGETLRWELGDDATYTTGSAADRAGWTVLDDHDPGPRQRIYRALSVRLRLLEETERERALGCLRSVSEPDGHANGEKPRGLTVDQLVRLAAGGLVDIGAHTVTHPVLSQLPPERQREELGTGKRHLERELGRSVSSFAYPYGAPGDFDETTVSLVRDAGFDHGCTTVPGRLDHRTDPFRLPRVLVRNWSGRQLARRLSAIA